MKQLPTEAWKHWHLTDSPNTQLGEDSRRGLTGRAQASLRTFVARFAKFRLGLFGRRTLIAVVVIAALVLVGASFLPLRQYREQGESIAQKELELSELEQLRTELQTKLDRAKNQIEKERIARKQMSYVQEGDELFRVVVVPADIVDLPRAWHLPGVKYLITGKLD